MLTGHNGNGSTCTEFTLLVARGTDSESCSELFVKSKEGSMWLVALGVQGAAWTFGAAPLLAGLAAWRRADDARHWAAEITATGVAGAVLVLGPAAVALLAPIGSPLNNHSWRMTAITGLGAVTAAAGFANLAVLDLSARRMRVQLKRRETTAGMGVAAEYLQLRRRLDALLVLLAALVTIAVLCAGLLMRAMQANVDPVRYSPALMWPYALYLVGVLALVYVPTHLRLLAVGEEMRDSRFPACLPGEPGYDEAVKHRHEMDDLLGLEEGPTAKLKSSLVILSPLLGSFVATVLGT